MLPNKPNVQTNHKEAMTVIQDLASQGSHDSNTIFGGTKGPEKQELGHHWLKRKVPRQSLIRSEQIPMQLLEKNRQKQLKDPDGQRRRNIDGKSCARQQEAVQRYQRPKRVRGLKISTASRPR